MWWIVIFRSILLCMVITSVHSASVNLDEMPQPKGPSLVESANINLHVKRSATYTDENAEVKALLDAEFHRQLAELPKSRKKRIAITGAMIAGVVSKLGGIVGGKLKDGLTSEAGKNLTSGLITGVVQKVMDSILNQNHMEDIHKEVSDYLAKWQEGSDVAAAKVTKELKAVIDSLAAKNSELLKSKAKINIIPQKGMDLVDMFSPPGYKITTSYESTKAEPDSTSAAAYVYDSGIANAIINGCYAPSLQVTDPCHAAKRLIPMCDKLLEGSTFIGVGFDGRGMYSSTSRKRSIIQRICLRGQSYDKRSVPDIMTVQGIYDTDVMTKSFSSMSGYQSYLEKKAAVAKSGYMFMDAVTKAYGQGSAGFLGLFGGGGGASMHGEVHASAQWSSSQSSHSISQQDSFQQFYMSLLEIEVARYEIFMDDVKPHDLNMDFLHDFTFLPTSYFSAGAPQKFQYFILQYGTHYIKSAKFGGSLRLFKVKRGSKTETVDQFATKAQSDYKAMFSTYMAAAAQFHSRSLFHKAEGGAEGSVAAGGGGAGASETETQSSETTSQQQQYSNEVLTVEGGDQTIAAVISEMYTVGFKHELVDWLQSIPTYPKPIEMQMAPLSDICHINWKHLFPAGVVDFGCFGEEQKYTENGTDRVYWLWKEVVPGPNGTETIKEEKRYCDYDSQAGLQNAMRRRCNSLKRAIDVYLEEGPTPVNDIHIPAGRPGCETRQLSFDDVRHNLRTPEWDKMTDGRLFTIIFDLKEPILHVTARSSSLKVFFRPSNSKWYVQSMDEISHLYDGWGNCGSGDPVNKKISIRGLCMSYHEETGLLQLTNQDYVNSKEVLPDLPESLKNKYLARAEYAHILTQINQHKNEFGIGTMPCNVVWSNAHRINGAVTGGKCISFAGISGGDIFVIFSAIPRDYDTWYYVQISPLGVAFYKGMRIMKFVDDISARGLGDNILFQLYFVCYEEKQDGSGTTILYGKTSDTEDRGHVYGAFHDTGANLHVSFYAFGNGDREVSIMDAHVLSTAATGEHVCVGDTIQFEGKCVEDCHPQCIGCHQPDNPKSCQECKNKKLDDTCVAECPDTHMVAANGVNCHCKLVDDGECVTECSSDRLPIVQANGGSLCECRFLYPEQEETCLPGCPLNTYSDKQDNNQTFCRLCHAGCKAQAEGVPVCTGPAITECTECWEDGNGDCLVCNAGKYLKFSNTGNNPQCVNCPKGHRCPGDGRKYQCSVVDNEKSKPLLNTRDVCVACPAGKYSTIPPSDYCHSCSPGRYKKTINTICIQCPGNTAGVNCQVKCKCVYGKCIKLDGSCMCWKFFKGPKCDQPINEHAKSTAEGAIRLQDNRFKNLLNTIIIKDVAAKIPTSVKETPKLTDIVDTLNVATVVKPLAPLEPVIPKVFDGVKVGTIPVDKTIQITDGQVIEKQLIGLNARKKRALSLATLDVKKVYEPVDKELANVAIQNAVFKPIIKDKIPLNGKIRGTLQLYHNGQWGTACSKYWTQLNTEVACRQFFMSHGSHQVDAYFGQGKGPIWLTKFNCQGYESSLLKCPKPKFWSGLNYFLSKKTEPCLHKHDVGITCW